MKAQSVESSRSHIRRLGQPAVLGTVETVARATGIPAHVVRYYARIGLVKPMRDPHNDYKLFTGAQCERLLFIRRAQELGYTLREIRELLRDADRGRSPCPRAREIIERRIEENRRALVKLSHLQTRMEQALAAWRTLPDGIPDGHTVCHLIESVAGD